jgi:hypothetical protein
MKDRKAVWVVMEEVQAALHRRNLLDWPGLCRRARELLQQGAVASPPFDAVIADETQDLGPQELRFLAALAGLGLPAGNAAAVDLVLVGDGGQRIYGRNQSLKALGIDTCGDARIFCASTTAPASRSGVSPSALSRTRPMTWTASVSGAAACVACSAARRRRCARVPVPRSRIALSSRR